MCATGQLFKLSSVLENHVKLHYKVGCPFRICWTLPLNPKIGPVKGGVQETSIFLLLGKISFKKFPRKLKKKKKNDSGRSCKLEKYEQTKFVLSRRTGVI